ncbi:aminodeoxychorismate lyase [Dokdonella koreensis]|uniref:Aminodeoxychorismate lyase n=1 Tax=Dokdonella koreensis DS-123 TaxID=1300342 RepID=A0A160DUV5_9GAMM|nr:aminodeoxychorismate lyase [Dokdonella koreensis]ANB18287.1 Aminodeoxychorismate lyase [Dokdonella koreensis DS-123]
MSARIRIDGAPATVVDAGDRGLAYGDGLFETVLFVDGRAPLWRRHLARLALGCARLRLPAPDAAALAADCAAVTAGLPRAVVRITLTRGSGPRGYAQPAPLQPLRIVAAAAEAPLPRHWYWQGIRVRFCETRLAVQPLLAGIKHLNRLEQVLARAEWDDPAIAEGIVFDTEGRVVGATAANLFLVRDGCVSTPRVDRCGVAGVMRAELLDRLGEVRQGDIDVDELMQADEIFLSNAVRGVLLVTELGGRLWKPGPVGSRLVADLHTLGFGAAA